MSYSYRIIIDDETLLAESVVEYKNDRFWAKHSIFSLIHKLKKIYEDDLEANTAERSRNWLFANHSELFL